MTVKEYLRQARGIDGELALLNARIYKLGMECNDLCGKCYEDTKIITTNNEEAIFVPQVLKIQTEIKQLQERIELLYNLRREIMQVIDKLEEPFERQVLYRRYIEDKSWNDVAKAVYSCRSICCKAHKEALEKLELTDIFGRK